MGNARVGVGPAAWKNPALTVKRSLDKLGLPLWEAAHLAEPSGCLATWSLVTSESHEEAELPAFAESQQSMSTDLLPYPEPSSFTASTPKDLQLQHHLANNTPPQGILIEPQPKISSSTFCR
ncbi:hypothetical protein WN48_08007 [Eufriesea mexicana]|nr:hypothetical protein WN48_08007 [Eufriesea mexicana]